MSAPLHLAMAATALARAVRAAPELPRLREILDELDAIAEQLASKAASK